MATFVGNKRLDSRPKSFDLGPPIHLSKKLVLIDLFLIFVTRFLCCL